MLKRFLPKEDQFFHLFNEAADHIVTLTELFQSLLADVNQGHNYLQKIQEVENKGDKTIKETFTLLHKTFITPFDRHDIYRLATNLETVQDAIANNALTINLYEIVTLPAEVTILANQSHRMAKLAHSAIDNLPTLEKSDQILKCCDAIDDAKATAYELILTIISRLYKEESDIKQLLKLREIYDGAKNTMAGYQELANVIRTIVLEYA